MITKLKKYYVETWYDRKTRNWVTQIKDLNGFQIGDAEYDGTKADKNISHSIMVSKAKILEKNNETHSKI